MILIINFTIKFPIRLMSMNMLNLFTPPPKISAYQFVSGMMHPMQKQPNPNAAIEGPPRRIEELESDKED